jgi:hypothetical protein
MNRGQGLFAGALVAAALIMRGGNVEKPSQGLRGGLPPAHESGGTRGATHSKAPGPWLASCRYWAAVRQASNDATAGLNPAVATNKDHVELRYDGDAELLNFSFNEDDRAQDPGCGPANKRWGLPDELSQLNVTALIATVPDPVHTHMAMDFDRTIDTLLQAAADMGYLNTYFWLPWERHPEGGRATVSGSGQEPGHDALKEREPGLIILKKIPREGEPTGPSDSYCDVIYLFVIGETPTLGVDGFQFQKALSYEVELGNAIANGHYSRGKIHLGQLDLSASQAGERELLAQEAVTIIGPQFSGSAASLRAGIEAARNMGETARFEVLGTATTEIACEQLLDKDACRLPPAPQGDIRFHSFAGDRKSEEILIGLFNETQYAGHVGKLVEDDTTFGRYASSVNGEGVYTIRYPREISLLRNAEVENESSNGSTPGSIPSPYLRFSVKDSGAQDAVPEFSTENMPLSQEAQLMTIARQLRIKNIRVVFIEGSSGLDQIFLARFLHRADPDVQLILGNDLLMTRELDNQPYIGSVAASAYNLIGIGTSERMRAHPNGVSKALYVATSYGMWEATQRTSAGTLISLLTDTGYSSPVLNPGEGQQPPLWATVIGRDGYYPIGILHPCATKGVGALPRVLPDGTFARPDCRAPKADVVTDNLKQLKTRIWIYPSLSWMAISWAVLVLCVGHAILLFAAEHGSNLSQDLDIQCHPQVRRRSMFIHVSTAALVLMAFIVGEPAWVLHETVNIPEGAMLSLTGLLIGGMATTVVTLWKTVRVWDWRKATSERGLLRFGDIRTNFPLAGMALAWLATALIAGIWQRLCTLNVGELSPSSSPVYLKGVCFAYRCVYPASKVSPVVPVLLLLCAWYSWGVLQTRRLRFSKSSRPHLLQDPEGVLDPYYRVADEDLGRELPGQAGIALYDRIECPAFVWRMVRWHLKRSIGVNRNPGARNSKSMFEFLQRRGATVEPHSRVPHDELDTKLPREAKTYAFLAHFLDWAVAFGAAVFFAAAAMVWAPHSFDHFAWQYSWNSSWKLDVASPYEFLIALLLFPLMWLSLSNWLRVVSIWIELKRALLSRLEDQPMRFAFNRLQVTGWMTMLGMGSVRAQRRDMERCLESMRHMLRMPDLTRRLHPDTLLRLSEMSRHVTDDAKMLEQMRQAPHHTQGLGCMMSEAVDLELAEFSRELMAELLIPYWRDERVGLVESRGPKTDKGEPEEAHHSALYEMVGLAVPARDVPLPETPPGILAAEEFVGIRYMSMIRAVLSNVRYLMVFISLTFVLSIIAWNSYPFQQRQVVDWLFTSLLILMGVSMIVVFAQMHRDAILSRLSDTEPHKLGADFYLRVVSFGAIPVLTWLAYQFPEIAESIYKFIAPGASVFK